MFEFLFKYPASVFAKGTFVFLGGWPKWALLLAAGTCAAVVAGNLWGRKQSLRRTLRGGRALALWSLQSALLALLLLLLWEPAISVTMLKPQQNVVAVVVDDSRSMSLKEGSSTREQQALEVLNSGLLTKLRERFQVRLYRLGNGLDRVPDTQRFTASQPTTQIGKGLRQLADEAATLPIGAVVLVSDGADNTGGVDLATLGAVRRRRLPVSTIGIGRETIADDVELDGLELPPKALAGSRLEAQVRIHQNGFSGKQARLVLTGGGAILATRDVTLAAGPQQVEPVEFSAGKAGVQNIQVRIDPLPGEENIENNQLTRVLSIDGAKRRILYVEGEPRWEYKFLRRAVEDDPAVAIVSMLRTTPNKIYRQGLSNPNELAEGFPSKAEDLFAYQGIILGSVESAFFTPVQQQLLRDFVDRRGGGILFEAGRFALSDGGYNAPPFAELLPVVLPQRKNTFERKFVAAELTEAGANSLLCRIENTKEKSLQHWNTLPYLANYQDVGAPKPGAVVLARVDAGGKHLPLLVTENYGRGRTAVFATAGSWRWRMQQPVADQSEETFWRQLSRWIVSATPTPVTATTPNAQLEDDGTIELRAEVRDKTYLPASDATVEARIIAPDGSAETIPLRPEPLTQGIYAARWNATQPGSYIAEITAGRDQQQLGKDVLTFRREDGVEENFHREQNRELLEKLASETGGRYYTRSTAKQLPDEIAYSEAGITAREVKDLWNMPAVFLTILLLKASEWLLRRRWGAV